MGNSSAKSMLLKSFIVTYWRINVCDGRTKSVFRIENHRFLEYIDSVMVQDSVPTII
jgi:hypothetical protein